MEADELLKKVEEYADSQKMLKLNPDDKVVITLIKGLLKNEERYGHQYCPCRPVTGNKQEDAKKICPCVWHKDEIKEMGHCTCGLFVVDKA